MVDERVSWWCGALLVIARPVRSRHLSSNHLVKDSGESGIAETGSAVDAEDATDLAFYRCLAPVRFPPQSSAPILCSFINSSL